MVPRIMSLVPSLVAVSFVIQGTRALTRGEFKTPRSRRTGAPSRIIYRATNPGQFWFVVWSSYAGAAVALLFAILVFTGALDAMNRRALQGPSPNVVRARETAQRAACINNLRQLEGAIQQFALENRKRPTDPVTLNDLMPYLKGSLVCPAGGTSIRNSYRVTDCQSPPTCISAFGRAAHGHVLPRR
jgi:hypothetical protein